MRKLLLLTASCLLLFACKKGNEENTGTEEKPVQTQKYSVNFNITGFTQEVVPINQSLVQNNKSVAAVSPITNYADKLNYIVYDNLRNQVSRLIQFKSEPNVTYRIANDVKTQTSSTNSFGNITDELSPGTYTVVVIGSPGNVSVNRRGEGATNSNNPKAYPELPLTTAKMWWDTDNAMADCFITKTTMTVGNANLSQSLSLNRCIGIVKLVTKDIIPANAKFIEIGFDNEKTSLNFFDSQFGDKTPDGLKTRFDVSTLAGKSVWTHSRYIFNTLSPITMNVTVLDATEKVLITKNVPDIQILINRQTNVVGNLFSKSTESVITVDPVLGSEITKNF